MQLPTYTIRFSIPTESIVNHESLGNALRDDCILVHNPARDEYLVANPIDGGED